MENYEVEDWPAAWREISIAFDTPCKKRTGKQGYITEWGLCYALYKLTGVSHGWAIIKLNRIVKKSGFWWNCRQDVGFGCVKFENKWDHYRATFAGLMAAMTHQEFERFLEWCEKH